MYTCEQEYTETLVTTLISKLELLKSYWIKFQFSFTPNMHLLLEHLIFQIWELQGGGDMSESFIELFHQTRNKLQKKIKGLRSNHTLTITKTNNQNLKLDSNLVRVK